MLLFSLIPIFSWLLLVILIFTQSTVQGPFTKLRIAMLVSCIIHGLIVAIITEGLNAYSAITFPALLIVWLIILLALSGICLYKHIRIQDTKVILTTITSFRRFGWMAWLIGAVLLVSLFLALIFPPNNYDSMTYHMARVAHWMQNKSIAHYQTHVLRQLVYQPFAEWSILHFQVLTRGDVLANSVQLFYFANCISAISLITKELGGSGKQQLLTAFFAALIPMALIESNTTQNDLVAAFFILAFGYFTMRIAKRLTVGLVMLAGISMGLAFLTKGTSYIYALPFCGWYLIFLIKDYRLPVKKVLGKALLFCLIPLTALLLNVGFFYRNIFLNESALGNSNKDTGNQGMVPKQLAFVAVKNIMNHLPTTGKMKEALTQKAISAGIDIDDSKYNFVPTRYMREGIFYHEDYMQNFIYVILILLTSIFFLFKKELYNSRISYYVLFVCTIASMVFLFTLLLKWQPWSNRLQITLFLLYCSFLGTEIAKLNKWIQAAFIIPVLIFSYGALFTSSNHPFPFSKRIYNAPLESSLIPNVAKELKVYLKDKPYTKLGLYIGADSWDYPYYRYLSLQNDKPRTIKHVFVNNESSLYLDNFVPEAIISLETSRDKYTINGIDYNRTVVFQESMAIFEPQ